ncbi:MAG TPA: hypothetical protein VMF89_04960 [Polyangiales bacterium]|nr:hypothetical protein [Polyangiales bacterium]
MWLPLLVAGVVGCAGPDVRAPAMDAGEKGPFSAQRASSDADAMASLDPGVRRAASLAHANDVSARWRNAQAVYWTPACQAIHACLREKLPARYHPRRYTATLAAARQCVSDVSYDGPCLPFTFGNHADSQRPVALAVTSGGSGCIAHPELAIVYEGVDYEGCHCLGLPGGYQGQVCSVLPGPGIRRRSLGIRSQPLLYGDEDLLPATGLEDRELIALDGSLLESSDPIELRRLLRLYGQRAPSSVVVQTGYLERAIAYKQFPSGDWLQQQLSALSLEPETFAQQLAQHCPPSRQGDNDMLIIALDGVVTTTWYKRDCKQGVLGPLQRLEQALLRLSEPTRCEARPLSPAGLQCVPGLSSQDYVVLGRELGELHVLEQPFVDVVCARVSERLSQALPLPDDG